MFRGRDPNPSCVSTVAGGGPVEKRLSFARRLPSRRRAVIRFLGGATFARFVGAAISPLLTRLYSPRGGVRIHIYGF